MLAYLDKISNVQDKYIAYILSAITIIIQYINQYRNVQ